VPVRIHFRGLILFRFPEAQKIVAELISPDYAEPRPGDRQHPHHHQSEIQVLDGTGPSAPRPLRRGDVVSINAPKDTNYQTSPSFDQYVPSLREIAAHSDQMSARAKGPWNDAYLRSTVIINGGLLRVRSVVTWDASGFPLDGGRHGNSPARPGELKFLGSDLQGNMANEVVVEIDAASVKIDGAPVKQSGKPNPYTSSDGVEILINNFEFQRTKPTPWGIDFQWLFMRAGYAPVNLDGAEYARFTAAANKYDGKLWDEDRTTLLAKGPGEALPFPYLVANRLTPLTPLMTPKPAAEIDSRPVCVPAKE
jgi:hypothetical protein